MESKFISSFALLKESLIKSKEDLEVAFNKAIESLPDVGENAKTKEWQALAAFQSAWARIENGLEELKALSFLEEELSRILDGELIYD